MTNEEIESRLAEHDVKLDLLKQRVEDVCAIVDRNRKVLDGLSRILDAITRGE